MTIDPPSLDGTLHPLIAAAYESVQAEWLTRQGSASGYRSLGYEETRRQLKQQTMLAAAAQFYTFFPAHYAKVADTIQTVIGSDMLASWVRHNPRICALDIGCGAGAASAALIGALLRLEDQLRLPEATEVFCVGVDPNWHAIAIYHHFIEAIKSTIAAYRPASRVRISATYRHRGGIPGEFFKLLSQLQQRRETVWQQPYLPRVLVFQANVISPLSETFKQATAADDALRAYGVPIEDGNPPQFGREEAVGYRQLLEEVPIDRLYVITIGTKDGSGGQYLLSERVNDMAKAIDHACRIGGHASNLTLAGERRIELANPTGSYWRDLRNKARFSTSYYVAVNRITNAKLSDDEDWKNIVHEDNLMLAWARARANVLNEALCDELEVRLFEASLRTNIRRLRESLLSYRNEVLPTEDQISYGLPKNATSLRPYALTRLEEEIVSVALIQRMGTIAAGLRSSSYAYRVQQSYKRATEDLYVSWFSSHQQYIADARSAAAAHVEAGAVIQADISAFYKTIIQERMVEFAKTELRAESERVRWLIRRLISRSLAGHEEGRGLSQGAIGSGFFANAYLTPLDASFGASNEWSVKFFRYVDDTILVLPRRESVKPVLSALHQVLADLGLELNVKKTKVYSDVFDFLRDTAADEAIEKLQERVRTHTEPLWILNTALRTLFVAAYRRPGNEWWSLVERYEIQLRSVGIYVSTSELSRKIVKYLFNKNLRQKCLAGQPELPMPDLSLEPSFADRSWARSMQFWKAEADAIREELARLFVESVDAIDRANPDRRLQRRIRFASRRLMLLGLHSVSRIVANVLCNDPWLLGDPLGYVDGLGRCECHTELEQILHSYHQDAYDADSQYMRAVAIRAIRFLPVVVAATLGSLLACATGSGASTVEKLAATETILAVGDRIGIGPDDRRGLEKVVTRALTEEIRKQDGARSNRLIKNYMLILGSALPESVADEPAVQADYMLCDTYKMAKRGAGAGSLFVDYEPDVIRFEYYGGAEGAKSYDDVW